MGRRSRVGGLMFSIIPNVYWEWFGVDPIAWTVCLCCQRVPPPFKLGRTDLAEERGRLAFRLHSRTL
jgi:hypothetical protein